MASMREIRPGVWKLTAYAGYDDGVSRQRHRTFRGNKSEVRKARDAFQKELDERRTPTVAAGTVGEILEEFWRKHAWKTPGLPHLDGALVYQVPSVPRRDAQQVSGFGEGDGQTAGEGIIGRRGHRFLVPQTRRPRPW